MYKRQEQGGGGIRAAATDTAAHGQALVQPDIGAQRGAGGLLQASGGAHDQVAVMRHAVDGRVQVNLAILTQAEAELVAMVEKLEQGLQLVIAIGAAAEDCLLYTSRCV